MTQYELEGSEASFSVEVARAAGGFRITIGGKTFLLKLERTVDPRVLVAQIADKPIKVMLEEATDRRVTLVIGGERLQFEKPLPAVNALQVPVPARTGPKDQLVAPMPGRIVGVSMKKGESLKAGDPVVIIESMKMESIIRADRDARVSEVLVAEGSTVKRGQPLVRFATEEPS